MAYDPCELNLGDEELRERWPFNIDVTIYNRSMNIYTITALYAPSPMPPEFFQSLLTPIFGASVFNSMGNANPYADHTFQDWRAVTVETGSLLRRQMLVDNSRCKSI